MRYDLSPSLKKSLVKLKKKDSKIYLNIKNKILQIAKQSKKTTLN